ncbi:hypothetical protein ASC90_14715 [Rhizobium sp. Root1220]|nr:hypothetical protein ASC90_14715 [Rhizobium sp. Root1220]
MNKFLHVQLHFASFGKAGGQGRAKPLQKLGGLTDLFRVQNQNVTLFSVQRDCCQRIGPEPSAARGRLDTGGLIGFAAADASVWWWRLPLPR